MRVRFTPVVAATLLLGGTGWAQTLTTPPPPGPPAAAPGPAPEGRVFCNQPVNFTVAPRETMPEPYRTFVGIFSDAAWNPQLCAALVVESVTNDGTATIAYVFGPPGASARGPGGVLHGTGIIRDGELKFQNNDGSQYAFKPFYSDLDGQWVTPKGQAYETIFKRSF